MDETRRRFLALGAGTIAAASAAGCLDSFEAGGAADIEDEEGGARAMASFFTLYDFTRNVGGEGFEVENAVPAGQHGHGWEPQADITPEVLDRDAFVYLGVEGFQRWADEVASEADADDDTVVIPAADGIDLSEYDDHGHDHHHGDEGDHHHGDEEGHHDDGHHHDEDDHHHDDHDHDHEHGDYDPHFWVDPVRAQQAVENVRDGLREMDGENAETYEENAEAYVAELEELHERFEEELADREHEVVVVAGHDAYGYLGERYGFEIHTPQGVSPDAEPSPGEIAETIDLVDEEGIEYVLYDYFDGDTLARTIVEEAESASDVAMLSPAESVTEEWEAEGLGYVGQMEEINLPSLRRALGAE